MWSRAARRTPTLLVTFAGHEASEVTRRLAEGKVLAPSGNFYALEASRHLGLGDAGGLRVGLAPYTDADDVDRLLDGLAPRSPESAVGQRSASIRSLGAAA